MKQLHDSVQELEKGNFDRRLTILTKDEFGDLGAAFNQMVTRVQTSHQELEAKVVERTAELEKAKSGLESTVVERTKELDNRLDEAEKFNELTINRELKMVELKNEIAALKKQREA